MTEPTGGLQAYQSTKKVRAGRITEVVLAGCYVEQADGDAILMIYQEGMTVRYQPQVGDYWVVYEPDGYSSVSPKAVFESGYVKLEG